MIEERMGEIKRQILYYESLVELMVDRSIQGLIFRNQDILHRVPEVYEPQANTMEIEMEELCTRTLARFSPKAKDLRTLLMVLKMTNDLERMADLAAGIARSGLYLIQRPRLDRFIRLISSMGDIAGEMLRDSFTAFIDEDHKLAADICHRDKLVNEIRTRLIHDLVPLMTSKPLTVHRAVELINIANRIERIADLTTNIAEDVVYIATGEVIKHLRMRSTPAYATPRANTPRIGDDET